MAKTTFSLLNSQGESGDILLYNGLNFWLQNGNDPYSVAAVDSDTLRFEVKSGDTWSGDPSIKERSEIASADKIAVGTQISINYDFKVEAGAANTAAFTILGQLHQNEDTKSGNYAPPFSIGLDGDKLVIYGRYDDSAGNLVTKVLYESAKNLTRDQWNSVAIKVTLGSHNDGQASVWLNGAQVVSYTGSLGYTDETSVYWKEGIYRGSAAETLAVDYKNLTISPINSAPIVAASAANTFKHDTTVALSSLFSTSDAQNDTITQYQLMDLSSGSTSGYVTVDGSVISAGGVSSLTAAQFANAVYHAGTSGDRLSVRAFDGKLWSNWTDNITSVTQHAPVAATTPAHIVTGTVAASSLFAVSDEDGDAITSYQVADWSAGATSGHFVVDGVAQAAGSVITLTAAQMAKTTFVGGTGDSLQFRASDGLSWSNWVSTTVAPPAAPLATGVSRTVAHGSTMSLASLVSVAPADQGTITAYQVIDKSTAATSGTFKINGVAQAAGQTLNIAASQLSAVTFQSGSGADALTVRAYNGTTWSDWSSMTVTAPVNQAPVVVASSATSVSHDTTMALSSLISAKDADGDAIQQYQVMDLTQTGTSGSVLLNGAAQTAGTVVNMTAAEFASAKYAAGSTGDRLSVRASDGVAWSAWTDVYTTVGEHAPVASAPASQVIKAPVAASSLFSVADSDGDAMTQYQIADWSGSATSGYFVVDGAVQAAGGVITLTAAQLAKTSFVGGTGDSLQFRAFDGKEWSNWVSETVVAEHAPVASAPTTQIVKGTVAASSLFSVTDADGDAMTQYQIADWSGSAASGHFVVNGVAQAAGSVITLTAAQFAKTSFVGGTGDSLQFRANDGQQWSNWVSETVTPPLAPVVAGLSRTVSHGATVSLASLVSVAAANQGTITTYEVIDQTISAASGNFTVNGVAKTAGQTLDIAASDLSSVAFKSGSGADALAVRVYDGTNWSDWSSMSVTAPLNHAPVVANSSTTITHNATVALSSLVSATDADGDAVTQYQINDLTAAGTSGSVVLNGVAQSAGSVVTMTAADLVKAQYAAGTSGDRLSVRASDGVDWSAWTDVYTSVVQHAPVASAPATQTIGGTVAASSLFSVSDADGDAMTKYQVADWSTGGSTGYFVVDGVAQGAGKVIDLTAAQLSKTNFVGGTGGDSLQFRASDGLDWSNWVGTTVKPRAVA